MRLREAHVSDLPKIVEVEKQCFRDRFPLTYLAQLLLSKHSIVLVAEEGNKLIGYVAAICFENQTSEIASIAVIPSMRGRGIGTIFLHEIEKRLISRGCEKVQLHVRVSNKNAIHLYLKEGYKIKGIVENYYIGKNDGSRDAFLMVKKLYSQGSS